MGTNLSSFYKTIQFLQDDLVPILKPFDGMNLNSIVVMGRYEMKRHLIAGKCY